VNGFVGSRELRRYRAARSAYFRAAYSGDRISEERAYERLQAAQYLVIRLGDNPWRIDQMDGTHLAPCWNTRHLWMPRA
jgi:hypothetical protein